MNALKATKINVSESEYSAAKTAWSLSLLLHVFILIAGMISFSFHKPVKQIISPPIQVEFVRPQLEEEKKKPELEKPKAVPFADSQLIEPVPVEKKIVPPEVKPELEKPKAIPKIVKKKPVTPKEIIEKAKEKKEQKQAEFSSVLKNLIQDEPEPLEVVEESETEFPQAVLTRAETVLSLSEQNALRQQLAQCWHVLPGAANAEDLVVRVQLMMAPDATVQSAKLLDSWKYNSNPFYRAAAESALRAVRNPLCNPLKLPLNKYEQWKKITINFDPKDMF